MCCHSAVVGELSTDIECPSCKPCYTNWKEAVDKTFRIAGAFGLVFSLSQVIVNSAANSCLLTVNNFPVLFPLQIAGIVVTYRYRNEKDPMINPNSFL